MLACGSGSTACCGTGYRPLQPSHARPERLSGSVPDLLCRVSYLAKMESGELRASVFEELYHDVRRATPSDPVSKGADGSCRQPV